ncbi:hypothetical protein SAMN05216404_1268 [Nitrosospira multiformis]|uniref:Uncharacterized protein n=1 Tax=Nitrosospira multiformis TaxID=1231 RepID=A0A1H8Q3G0_9PROT|nr:hypothetical protein SAMN05216404_1268 [Nitrosospira multiformis]
MNGFEKPKPVYRKRARRLLERFSILDTVIPINSERKNIWTVLTLWADDLSYNVIPRNFDCCRDFPRVKQS